MIKLVSLFFRLPIVKQLQRAVVQILVEKIVTEVNEHFLRLGEEKKEVQEEALKKVYEGSL